MVHQKGRSLNLVDSLMYSLDLVDSNYVLPVTKQSELDLAYGCSVQTHGDHLIRVNTNANSTGMATKSNIVICRKPVGKLKLKMRKINFRYIFIFDRQSN